jgi:outer membrane protein OmpA-like peptidoglycan-associated protein
MGGALRGFNYADNRGGYYVWNNYDHQPVPLGVGSNKDGTPAGDVYDHLDKFSLFDGKNGAKGFWQDFNYGTATLDLMANFTNLFRGHYQPHNPIDVIPFAGLGVIHAFPNHLTTPSFFHFVAKVGFRVNFNLNEKWSIYLEPQTSLTDKEFDGYVGTSSADGVVNLGLGVQYTFSKKYNTNEVAQLTADEIDKLNKKINDNRYLIDNHQDILERQQNLLDKLQKCCDEKPKQIVTQVVDNSGCLPQYVRFSLDSYKIEISEQAKIAEVVDYLKKNPASKIYIVGYADRKTGNPSYNFKLSKRRVDAVAAELKRAGINENRIISDWKGDKEQPFPPNDWNRVVVMVERK